MMKDKGDLSFEIYKMLSLMAVPKNINSDIKPYPGDNCPCSHSGVASSAWDIPVKKNDLLSIHSADLPLKTILFPGQM